MAERKPDSTEPFPPCYVCDEEFTTLKGFLQHLIWSHHLQDFNCQFQDQNGQCCEETHPDLKEFSLHVGIRHMKIFSLLPITYKKKVFKTIQGKKERRNTVKEEEEEPDRSTTGDATIEEEEPDRSTTGVTVATHLPLKCVVCEKPAKTRSTMINHMVNHHLWEKFMKLFRKHSQRCELCPKPRVFVSVNSFAFHQLAYHTEEFLPSEYAAQLMKPAPKPEVAHVFEEEEPDRSTTVYATVKEEEPDRSTTVYATVEEEEPDRLTTGATAEEEEPDKSTTGDATVATPLPLKCVFCEKPAKSRSMLINHLIRHLRKKFTELFRKHSQRCKLCPNSRLFVAIDSYGRHQLVHHTEEFLPSEYAAQLMKPAPKPEEPHVFDLTIVPPSCAFCAKSFKPRSVLITHMIHDHLYNKFKEDYLNADKECALCADRLPLKNVIAWGFHQADKHDKLMEFLPSDYAAILMYL